MGLKFTQNHHLLLYPINFSDLRELILNRLYPLCCLLSSVFLYKSFVMLSLYLLLYQLMRHYYYFFLFFSIKLLQMLSFNLAIHFYFNHLSEFCLFYWQYQKVISAFCQFLKKFHPLYLHVFNHITLIELLIYLFYRPINCQKYLIASFDYCFNYYLKHFLIMIIWSLFLKSLL